MCVLSPKGAVCFSFWIRTSPLRMNACFYFKCASRKWSYHAIFLCAILIPSMKSARVWAPLWFLISFLFSFRPFFVGLKSVKLYESTRLIQYTVNISRRLSKKERTLIKRSCILYDKQWARDGKRERTSGKNVNWEKFQLKKFKNRYCALLSCGDIKNEILYMRARQRERYVNNTCAERELKKLNIDAHLTVFCTVSIRD
jgi:hypothetical protein